MIEQYQILGGELVKIRISETMKALWRKERMRAIYGLKRETRLRINI